MINNRMRTTYILTSQLLTIDIRNFLKPYSKIKLMLNIKDVAENDNVENEITKSNRSLVPDPSTGSDEDFISIPGDTEAAVDMTQLKFRNKSCLIKDY